ncbi:MAG: CheR family methyltransferase, partial [Bdellovibrionota bacterium]
PTHESMMVSLLAPHARMQVREAADGMRVEPNNVYVIAPGTYLAIRHGTLWVSEPKDRHGARLPVDFLFRSMAEACGERAIAVVLSGNGADGSLGAKTINERGGLVIAQEPEEAAYAGMPKSAIGTGIVDLVMPIQKMAASIASYTRQMDLLPRQSVSDDTEGASADLRLIIDLLRSVATADYSSYKPGTLMRRIRRRMAIRAVGEVRAYLEVLRADAKEVDILARDLLIHVTGFFRDKDVFDLLATKIIPDLVRDHPAGQTLRVWVPACSSGEEVYSLAMLFLEEIAAKNKGLKLQIFGSDIDEHAVAMARAGRYPASLRSEVSPERLARFFAEDADGYRVMPSLREMVIFTVQDVLTDPPFAQLDFISCRNLLIYLLPEAQHRVLSLLHFALRKDGILMLGIAESVSALNGDFDPVSEGLRVFRRIGGIRRLKPQVYARDRVRGFWPRPPPASTPEVSPGEIARNLLIAAFAPASVLIDHRHHSLFYFGPTDSYLKISAGDAAHDLFAMVRPGLRNKLRAAVQRARREETLVSIAGGAVEKDGESRPVLIEVRPVASGDKPLFLVSFIASNKSPTGGTPEVAAADAEPGKIALLEKVIETLRQELEETGRQLETVSADHEAINEEAQSLNEEYQSTNEELETSKEELQSVNEELTALNAQLTATVQQQRTTADDLDNILRSSEVAIVFLDLGLNIRFFSAAAKTLLNIIDTDIGRPIGDLAHHFDHSDLVVDARGVLRTAVASRREIRSHGGDWFSRQILPYRSATGAVQGVVLIFSNISLAKAAELKIETARTYADKVIDTVRQPLAVIDERLRLISVNSAFCTAFRTQPKDLIGRGLTAFGDGRLDLPAMNNFLDRARAEVAPIEDYELACDLPGLGPRILLLSSRKIPDGDNAGQRILVAIEDITDRKQITDALEIAKSKAEKANLGKSRFLAAASHDLRQPLQTLSLLHGVLARKITDHESLGLIGKLAETLGAMSGMLDTLLD